MDLNCNSFSVYVSDDTKLVPKLSSWSHNIINKAKPSCQNTFKLFI